MAPHEAPVAIPDRLAVAGAMPVEMAAHGKLGHPGFLPDREFSALTARLEGWVWLNQTPDDVPVALQMQQMALVMQKQMHMQQQGAPGPQPDPSGLPMNANPTQQQFQGPLVPFHSFACKSSQLERYLPCTESPLPAAQKLAMYHLESRA